MWRRRKAAAIVKLLALSMGHRMHREQLMDVLWPGLGRRAAANNLRQVLYVARRIFDPDPSTASRYLTLQDDQLALCSRGQLLVDVEAFEEAADAARRSKDPAAYQAAIELYAEELLPEDRYEVDKAIRVRRRAALKKVGASAARSEVGRPTLGGEDPPDLNASIQDAHGRQMRGRHLPRNVWSNVSGPAPKVLGPDTPKDNPTSLSFLKLHRGEVR